MRMCRRAITTLIFSAMSLVLPLRRMPAVSTNTYSVPSRVTFSSTASRVVPAMGETMARSWPVRAFSSVDLPTLGRPMMATLMPSFGWLGLLAGRGEAGGDMVEQRVDADAVLGRNREYIRDSQAVELVRQVVALGGIDLVDRQGDRLAEALEHLGQVAVGAGDFGAAVHQEDDVTRPG